MLCKEGAMERWMLLGYLGRCCHGNVMCFKKVIWCGEM